MLNDYVSSVGNFMQKLDEGIETFAAQSLTLAKVSHTCMPGLRLVLVISSLLSIKS